MGNEGISGGWEVTQEEASIVDYISNALTDLNSALAAAHVAGIDVSITSTLQEWINHKGSRAHYSAEISKKAFTRRVCGWL
jgi:hypothetical protein